jgi:hypothetical protein
MTVADAGLRRTKRLQTRGDAGATLIDVMVSMVLMSIFMAMFTGGIVQMFRAANKTEAVMAAQTQLHIAFLRLDRELRYASAISASAAVGPDAYVEYLTTNTGTPVCTQLRLRVATAQLQRRTWVQGSSPLTPSPWTPLVSDVSSTEPFRVLAADAVFSYQRLEVELVASSGSGDTASTKQTRVTFTALNTSVGTPTDTVCTEGRSVP